MSAAGAGGTRPSRFPPSLPPPHSSKVHRKGRVLVIDDDATSRRGLGRALLDGGFEVDTAESGAAALDLLATRDVDAALVDHAMPELDGLATMTKLRERHPEVELVALVPHADPRFSEAALAIGATALVPAPIESPIVLRVVVERAIERARLARRVGVLARDLAELEGLGPIVGSSSRLVEALRKAELAAASSAHVLVLGEPGSGKSLLAKSIQRRSPRARAALVTTSPRLWTEGADAGEDHASAAARAIDAASGGTLILEELDEMKPRDQEAFVAAMARADSDAPRVIATARPEVREAVESGAMRRDLFYPLAAVLLELPPLRERRDDIPTLAYHFLTRFAAREGKDIRRIGPEALRALREGGWPGNVAELRRAIEHAVVFTSGETILPSSLPPKPGARGRGAPHVEIVAPELLDLPYPEARTRALLAFEHAYLAHCLERTGGNMSEAAKLAQMDRSNFRRILRRTT